MAFLAVFLVLLTSLFLLFPSPFFSLPLLPPSHPSLSLPLLLPSPPSPPSLSSLPLLPPSSPSRSPSTDRSDLETSFSHNHAYLHEVASLDINSSEFGSLPAEVQHELLLERQQMEKYSYNDPATLPQVHEMYYTFVCVQL